MVDYIVCGILIGLCGCIVGSAALGAANLYLLVEMSRKSAKPRYEDEESLELS